MCNLFIVALVSLIVGIIGLVLTCKNIVDFCYISIAGVLIAFIFMFIGFLQILEYNCFYAQMIQFCANIDNYNLTDKLNSGKIP